MREAGFQGVTSLLPFPPPNYIMLSFLRWFNSQGKPPDVSLCIPSSARSRTCLLPHLWNRTDCIDGLIMEFKVGIEETGAN